MATHHIGQQFERGGLTFESPPIAKRWRDTRDNAASCTSQNALADRSDTSANERPAGNCSWQVRPNRLPLWYRATRIVSLPAQTSGLNLDREESPIHPW